MRTSTRVFSISVLFYVASFGFYLYARKLWNNDLERLKKSIFWSSTLDIGPYTNWAHYCALGILVAAIAVTIAGILLRKSEG